MMIGKMIHDKMRHEGWQDEGWRMAKWNMTNDQDRHDIFPEDDILDIVTISRYNYHK